MNIRHLLYPVGPLLLIILFGTEDLAAQSPPDDRFGMTEVFWLPEEAKDLGVGWERILFYWREIQPSGPDDWNTLHVREEWLAEANAQGRTVVGLIKNTAPWASTDGTEAGVPRGLYLSTDDPDNLWANYVRRLAEYYREFDVHHWIIWNEPEIRPDVYGFEFAGSTSDYYQLLKSAYKVIKETDPEAVVHLAGLTWWHNPTFLDSLLALAAADPESADNDHFFDVISLHIYFRSETVRTLIEEVKTIQRRYGLEKPIWINETNAPPNRDPQWPVDRPLFNIDVEQQAWFIVQALALGFASGAERISVYKLIDIHLPPGGESFGVVRPDYSRRPAYDAYKLSTHCFGGFTSVNLREDPAYYLVTFERMADLVHVAWARTPKDASVYIPATTDTAALVDLDFSARDISPEGANYALTLPGQRCDEACLVGGAPVLLVEQIGESVDFDQCLTLGSEVQDSELGAESATVTPLELDVEESAPDASSMNEITPTAILAAPTLTVEAGLAPLAEQVSEELEAGDSSKSDQALAEAHGASDGAGDQTLNVPTAGSPERQPSETIGLWFLGAGAVAALGITWTWRRLKASRKP